MAGHASPAAARFGHPSRNSVQATARVRALTGGLGWNVGDKAWVTDEKLAWAPAVVTVVGTESLTVRNEHSGATLDVALQQSDGSVTGRGPRDSIGIGGAGGDPLARARHRVAHGKTKKTVARVLPRSTADAERTKHLGGVDNMDDMVHLHEAAILANLRGRFAQDNVYTATGPILIAMNPFKKLPIYEDAVIRRYAKAIAAVGSGLAPSEALAPHCYGVAARAYAAVLSGAGDQSLVICGESGAGKTETTKLMLRFLSRVGQKGGIDARPDSGAVLKGSNRRRPSVVVSTAAVKSPEGRHASLVATPRGSVTGLSSIVAQIMQSNPAMEAFGNAKTTRNDNSSRFGKFIRVLFGADGEVQGARISQFLLEKSRIVKQPEGERNYHIFYQLCHGMRDIDREMLGLLPTDDLNPSIFFYLGNQDSTVAGVDDETELGVTLNALDILGVEQDEKAGMLRVLLGVLHMGNVELEQLGDDADRSAVSTNPKSAAAIDVVGRTLLVDTTVLAESMTVRRISAPGGQTFEKPISAAEAVVARDALAKAVFGRLFNWMVERINEALSKEVASSSSYIGILDIFGFEDMAHNGLGQLFINYANEKLQQLFNEHIFKMERKEYEAEGIAFDDSDFPSNDRTLELLDKAPIGLLHLMDEQCMIAHATDDGLARKFHQNHRSHPDYELAGPSTQWRGREVDFVVRHYAGPVKYSAEGFVEENRDTLYDKMADAMASSTLPFLVHLFEDSTAAATMAADAGGAGRSRGARRSGKGKLQMTVGKRFRSGLQTLITTMSATTPHFVRCIKTNMVLMPALFDSPQVLRQLKYAGVMEALRVRRAGYPTRLAFREFLLRYQTLLSDDTRRAIKNNEVSDREQWATLISGFLASPGIRSHLSSDDMQLGKSKVFLRAEALHKLDQCLAGIQRRAATTLQSMARGRLMRDHWRRVVAAAQMLNKVSRGAIARKQVAREREAKKAKERRERAERAMRNGAAENAERRRAARTLVANAAISMEKLNAVRIGSDEPLLAVIERDLGSGVAQRTRRAFPGIEESLRQIVSRHARALEMLQQASNAVDAAERAAAEDAVADKALLESDMSAPERLKVQMARALEREDRTAEMEAVLKPLPATIEALVATVDAERVRRENEEAAFKEAELAREADERRGMAEAEAETRRFLAEFAELEHRNEAAELREMRMEEKAQRRYEYAVLVAERSREAEARAEMEAEERRMRAYLDSVRRAERHREAEELEAMRNEEASLRIVLGLILRAEREREAVERRRMAAEEARMAAIFAELRRQDRLRETRELLQMRREEALTRRLLREEMLRVELELRRKREADQRIRARELVAMRREEELLRAVLEQERREAALHLAQLRRAEAHRQAQETAHMAAEDADGLARRWALKEAWARAVVQWKAEEERREAWERRCMAAAERQTQAAARYAADVEAAERAAELRKLSEDADAVVEASRRIAVLNESAAQAADVVEEARRAEVASVEAQRARFLDSIRDAVSQIEENSTAVLEAAARRQAAAERAEAELIREKQNSPARRAAIAAKRRECQRMEVEDRRSFAALQQAWLRARYHAKMTTPRRSQSVLSLPDTREAEESEPEGSRLLLAYESLSGLRERMFLHHMDARTEKDGPPEMPPDIDESVTAFPLRRGKVLFAASAAKAGADAYLVGDDGKDESFDTRARRVQASAHRLRHARLKSQSAVTSRDGATEDKSCEGPPPAAALLDSDDKAPATESAKVTDASKSPAPTNRADRPFSSLKRRIVNRAQLARPDFAESHRRAMPSVQQTPASPVSRVYHGVASSAAHSAVLARRFGDLGDMPAPAARATSSARTGVRAVSPAAARGPSPFAASVSRIYEAPASLARPPSTPEADRASQSHTPVRQQSVLRNRSDVGPSPVPPPPPPPPSIVGTVRGPASVGARSKSSARQPRPVRTVDLSQDSAGPEDRAGLSTAGRVSASEVAGRRAVPPARTTTHQGHGPYGNHPRTRASGERASDRRRPRGGPPPGRARRRTTLRGPDKLWAAHISEAEVERQRSVEQVGHRAIKRRPFVASDVARDKVHLRHAVRVGEEHARVTRGVFSRSGSHRRTAPEPSAQTAPEGITAHLGPPEHEPYRQVSARSPATDGHGAAVADVRGTWSPQSPPLPHAPPTAEPFEYPDRPYDAQPVVDLDTAATVAVRTPVAGEKGETPLASPRTRLADALSSAVEVLGDDLPESVRHRWGAVPSSRPLEVDDDVLSLDEAPGDGEWTGAHSSGAAAAVLEPELQAEDDPSTHPAGASGAAHYATQDNEAGVALSDDDDDTASYFSDPEIREIHLRIRKMEASGRGYDE